MGTPPMSIAYPNSVQERLFDLGDVPAHRVLTNPSPGTATIDDLVKAVQSGQKPVELVDGTLVEKAMGWIESLLATVLIQWMRNYLDKNRLGVVTGSDGFTRLFGDTVRAPDLAFVAWDRLAGRELRHEPIPSLVPNLVVEVLSPSNTYGEMSRKRREYFQAGVQCVWMVEPSQRTITVYISALSWHVYTEGEDAVADHVLPGWKVSVSLLFAKLDELSEPPQ